MGMGAPPNDCMDLATVMGRQKASLTTLYCAANNPSDSWNRKNQHNHKKV